MSRAVAAVVLPAVLRSRERSPSADVSSEDDGDYRCLPAERSNENLACALAARLAEAWDQQVLVENKPGGNTLTSAKFVAKAAADGHISSYSTHRAAAFIVCMLFFKQGIYCWSTQRNRSGSRG